MRAAVLLPLALPVLGQQEVVTRYDAFVGYGFVNSPKIKLFENSFAIQAGVRPKTWYSAGFDYTNASGDLSLTPNLLPTSLQQQLAEQLARLEAAGLLPPGYKLTVRTLSRTQTFAWVPSLHIATSLKPLFLSGLSMRERYAKWQRPNPVIRLPQP